jgi:transposase-like protein
MEDKMARKRKRYTAEEKVAALKRHLLEGEEVSKICDELKIHITAFYDWQKKFFENGVKAFEQDTRSESTTMRTQIDYLQGKLQKKDNALAELLEEHIALKKSLGEL